MKNLDPVVLEKMYLTDLMTPYDISTCLGVDHKTVRAYLRKYQIPLRTASEYNSLSHQCFIPPTEEALMSPRSIAAHIAYLCEGHHTTKAESVAFCNQDPQLFDLVCWLLRSVYQARTLSIAIYSASREQAQSYRRLYPSVPILIETSRKNPILRVRSGGRALVRDLVQNAYRILNMVSVEGFEPSCR